MAEGNCIPGPDTICRANLDLMPEETKFWMYGLTLLALLIASYGLWQMVHVWRLGREWKRGGLGAGLKNLFVGLASHRKFMQDRKPGTMHAWIFFGFVALFIVTSIVALDMDFVELVLGGKLLHGNGYLLLEAFADTFGVVFVLGVLYAVWRRYVQRPPQLHRSKTPEAKWLGWMDTDLYALLFLLGIGLTGFFLEALRLQHQIRTDGITHASWSFVGNALGLAFQGMSISSIETVYPALWFVHFILWMGVLAILPWTKLRHIVTSSLNLMFVDPERQATAALSKPFDLQAMMESGDLDLPQVGVSTIRDFTWKDRLAFDACTNCGRCEAQCPANAAGRPLSPRKLIQDLKAHMWEDYRAGKKDGYESPRLTDVGDLGTQIEEATLWSCTTCRACMTECPVDINHVDMIVDMRRALVNESKLDEHQAQLIINLTNAGNPYGFPASDRADWRGALPGGLQVPLASEKAARGESFEYLWWVGCTGSFDPRNQEVTRSIATILNAAGVDFAVLGVEERCNGDAARRLGEEGRFQQSVMENLMVLQQYGVKKIIAQCPHCFNTFANEYPQFGGEFEVIHHTQLIERLLKRKALPLRDGKKMKIAYHDSCYLGRHNGVFAAPRKVLKQTNGLPVLEMAQSREQGLCCGAGGANMWYEIKQESERINVIRAKQAAETGADTVATNCPFCLTMVTDGISLTGKEEQIAVKDLAEIVMEHLDWSPPEPEPVVVEETSSGDAGGAVWVG